MITPADLAVIPLFAEASPENLERVAQKAADLRLSPGDFAAHEGDERALFVVLEGKLEVLKLVDGLEQTIGWAQRSWSPVTL